MKFGLRHIRYFHAVAEELNFRRAAERLHVSQPALSRAIQHLESDLELRLFERAQNYVRLTEAGQAFLDGSRTVLSSMEATVDLARRTARGETGALRIGYTDFAISGCLPQLLKSFHAEMPGITVKPHHGVTATQMDELAKDQLDVGFVTGPIRQPGYRSLALQRDRPICIVHTAHRLAGRASVSLGDLAEEDFVHGPASAWGHFFDYLVPLCRRAGFVPRIVQEAFNSVGILGLVSCGMGITILTEKTFQFASRDVVALPIRDLAEDLVTEAVWREDAARLPVRHFIRFLEETQAAQQH